MLYNTIKMTIAYFIPDACGREKENIRLKIPLAMIKKKKKLTLNLAPFLI